jgi:RNA polymerase sigma-70 factor (ECF subfamily)
LAQRFSGQAQAAKVALIDGVPGGVWPSATGAPIVVFGLTTRDRKVIEIELLADPERLSLLNVEILE